MCGKAWGGRGGMGMDGEAWGWTAGVRMGGKHGMDGGDAGSAGMRRFVIEERTSQPRPVNVPRDAVYGSLGTLPSWGDGNVPADVGDASLGTLLGL